MKCKHCGKYITETADYCPYCDSPLGEETNEDTQSSIPNSYTRTYVPKSFGFDQTITVAGKTFTMKQVFATAAVIIALVFIIFMSIPNKFHVNRFDRLKYISVEMNILSDDYKKACDKLENMGINDMDTNAWQLYYYYCSGCYAFQQGYYHSAYSALNEVRGFKDTEKYFSRDEYKNYADLYGFYTAYGDAVINFNIDGKMLDYYEVSDKYGAQNMQFELEAKGNNRYNMILTSDNHAYFYIIFLDNGANLYEINTDTFMGSFIRYNSSYWE